MTTRFHQQLPMKPQRPNPTPRPSAVARNRQIDSFTCFGRIDAGSQAKKSMNRTVKFPAIEFIDNPMKRLPLDRLKLPID